MANAAFCTARPLRKSKSSTGRISGLDVSNDSVAAEKSDTLESSSTSKPQPSEPVRPYTGNKTPRHDTTDASDHKNEGHQEELKDDLIEELEERVGDLERQLTREESEVEVRLVGQPETPTQEQIDQHNATHATYKSWCKHCVRGFATRDRHLTAKMKGKQIKKTKFGQHQVPDTIQHRLHAYG